MCTICMGTSSGSSYYNVCSASTNNNVTDNAHIGANDASRSVLFRYGSNKRCFMLARTTDFYQQIYSVQVTIFY